MENIQTAVEWLVEELGEYFPNEIGGIHLMVAKAKEMEKEQIMRAYMSGEVGEIFELKNTLTAKQYYDNNYGK